MKLIHKIADCDFCADGTPATYDEPTRLGWANVCDAHHAEHTANSPAGYRLTREELPERTDADIRSDLMAAVEAGDFDAAEDAIGDRDIAEFL